MTRYEAIFSEFKAGRIRPFYERMYPELLLYTSRLLGDDFAFLAEDCVQDAVFQTYRRCEEFRSPLQWKVFLYTCVRNGVFSRLRKSRAQRNYLAQVEEPDEDFSLRLIEQETLNLLYEAIESLPEKYRRIFDLSFEQGLRNAEVARQLQIAEITVKKHKARLIELLRERLRGRLDEESLGLLLLLLTGEWNG